MPRGIPAKNRRMATFQGRTLSTGEWAKETGISYATMEWRLKRVEAGKMSIDYAIRGGTLPRGGNKNSVVGYVNAHSVTYNGKTQTVREWAVELGHSTHAMVARVKKMECGEYTQDQAMSRDKLPRGWSSSTKPDAVARRVPFSAMMADLRDVPYEDDEFAQEVASRHRGTGIGHDLIGELYGLTPERVRQIEIGAIRKISAVVGAEKGEIIDALRQLDSLRRPNTNTFELEDCLENGSDAAARKRRRRKAAA